MADLIITYPDGRTVRKPLTLKPQELGRDPVCDVWIDDASTSRKHAEIRGLAEGQFILRDLGSKNGTLVNNMQITTHNLRHGDEILLGSVVARFQDNDAGLSESSVTIMEERPTAGPESISYAGRQERLNLSQQRLQSLYDISDRLTALRDKQLLLEDILRICIDTFDFERAAIAVKKEGGRAVDWPVVHNLRQPDGEIKLSRSILRQALEDGQRVIFSDTADQNLDLAHSIVQQGMRSAMCVPICYSDEILGVIYGDRISTTRKYEQEDVDFMAALARQASIGLTNARLLEQQQERAQLEGEIRVARQIQSGLFPHTTQIHELLEIAAMNDPGRQVSGDYYDLVPMSDGRAGVIIADVTGKGVAASLLSANLQAAVRVLLPDTTDLADLCTRLNHLVCDNTDVSRFITTLILVIDPRSRELSFVNAGHHMPFLVGPTACTEVQWTDNGPPFGIERDSEYRSITLPLKPEVTMLFMYTDGLNEAANAENEQFGGERLQAFLAAHGDAQPQRLVLELRQEVADFCGDVPQGDDITMLAIRLMS